jgi:hypothetical protein
VRGRLLTRAVDPAFIASAMQTLSHTWSDGN